MRSAKLVLLVIALLPLAGCTEGKPPHSQAWAEATGAEAYERLWWKAVQDHDFKTAERHLAPIYTLTTPAGIQSRDTAMQYFQSLNIASLNIAELEVRPAGPDMVVSYTATLQTNSSSTPQRYYMMTIWQQVTHGWIAIAHSQVPAKPAGE